MIDELAVGHKTKSLGSRLISRSSNPPISRIAGWADYPAAPYVESIGVQPDVTIDMMTMYDLLYNE